jgi:hypothetical protein
VNALTVASRLAWGEWIRGIFGALISGGAGAVGGGTGTSLVDPDHFNTQHPMLLLKVMGVTFLISGVTSLLKFLQTHPLPDEAKP